MPKNNLTSLVITRGKDLTDDTLWAFLPNLQKLTIISQMDFTGKNLPHTLTKLTVICCDNFKEVYLEGLFNLQELTIVGCNTFTGLTLIPLKKLAVDISNQCVKFSPEDFEKKYSFEKKETKEKWRWGIVRLIYRNLKLKS